MSAYLVGIDIGNTNIKIGVFRTKSSQIQRFYFPTNINSIIELEKKLKEIKPKNGVIVSVVPSITEIIINLLEDITRKKPLIVNNSTTGDLKISVKNPEKFGPDRIVNAVAAYKIVKSAVIVIDSGTATTTTVVTESGEIVGGTIMPGLQMMFKALHEYTATLPYINNIKKLESTLSLYSFGNDTKNSIISGILYGTAGAIERIVKEISKEINKTKIILTGGGANILTNILKIKHIYEPILSFKGLKIIYEHIKR